MSAPILLLSAAVPEGNRIRGFFGPGGEIRSTIERPPEFRWAGFDLGTGGEANLIPPDCFEVTDGGRKRIRLYQDGTLIVRAAADSDFLGWGVEPKEFERFPRLNPVAVVECLTAFVYLYAKLLDHLVDLPEPVEFGLRFRNGLVGSQRLALTPYYSGGIQNVFHPKFFPIHSADAESSITELALQVRTYPNAVAYELVAKLYGLFDAPAEIIPFTKEVEGRREIDIQTIQGL